MTQPIAQGDAPARRTWSAALLAWALITVATLACLAVVAAVRGPWAIRPFVDPGPYSDPYLTLAAVACAWVLVGAVLLAIQRRWIHSGNAVAAVAAIVVLLLYINILRERTNFGDAQDYARAAIDLSLHKPLPARYVYPPLWATLLRPLAPFGQTAICVACWLLNLVSLAAFYFLLRATLRRYAFSDTLSVAVTFAFLVVNVPVMRTLGYVQINLHVMDLILASLLLYPRSRLASALMLALAVHLKATPAILAIGFLIEKDWRWLGWFVAGVVAVAAGLVLVDGPGPFADFVSNARGIYAASDLGFRDNSIDSLFRALEGFWGWSGAWTAGLIISGKVLLVAASGLVLWRCLVRRPFAAGDAPGARLYNAVPVLLVLMTMISPLVWEHHPVFLALSYLVLLRGISTPADWAIFSAAYLLEFLLPTFDAFPWSYGRLLSPLLWLAFLWALCARPWPSATFEKACGLIMTSSQPLGASSLPATRSR